MSGGWHCPGHPGGGGGLYGLGGYSESDWDDLPGGGGGDPAWFEFMMAAGFVVAVLLLFFGPILVYGLLHGLVRGCELPGCRVAG